LLPCVFIAGSCARNRLTAVLLTISTLYALELRATMRGRFAWIGAGVVLLAIGGLAAGCTQDTWLDSYGIIAYGLVPLMFVPLTAGMIASPRANRFVESVFTAPVRRGDWLAAKILVLITMAAAYYAALMPMMLVYVSHIGMPLLLLHFMYWTPGLLLSSVSVGTLVGVLFIGRSLAAPTGAGMGILLAYAGLLPLQELMVSQANGATRGGHLTLVSTPVLLKNALGFAVATGSIPATTTMTWISVAVIVVGTLTLASWIFLRAQGVETWEATRAQRWTIGASVAAIGLFPVLFADTNYDAAAPRLNDAPAIRGLYLRAGSSLALVRSGDPAPSRCCGTILNRDDWPPLGTDAHARRDLLLLLPVDASAHLTNLVATVTGENGLEVSADRAALNQNAPELDVRAYANDSGPTAPDGHHIVNGLVARIPVTLNPTKPWDIGGDRYPLSVIATYSVTGDSMPRTFSARAAVDAQVAHAIYEMAAAGLVLPIGCFWAACVRWRRTR
jgi:ABC-type transport system involved in multi-copper enzyme maturation permease subunit